MNEKAGHPRPTRQRISTGTPWEAAVGYCRAVRAGRLVFVAGTLAADESGRLIGEADAEVQTTFALRKIELALLEAGATRQDIVRTRIFTTDQDRWREIGAAHASFFGEHRPATTMVEIQRLALEGAIVEIEADAVIDAPVITGE